MYLHAGGLGTAIIIILSVGVPLLIATVSLVIIIVSGVIVKRHCYKKPLIHDHVYDSPYIYELPPSLPPPRAVNILATEPSLQQCASASAFPKCVAEEASFQDKQQACGMSLAATNSYLYANSGEDTLNGIDSETDLTVQKPNHNSCEVDTNPLEVEASSSTPLKDVAFGTPTCMKREATSNTTLKDEAILIQKNDAYGLASNVQSPIPSPPELVQQESPESLITNGQVSGSYSEFRSLSHYQQICSYEKIQTCDLFLHSCNDERNHDSMPSSMLSKGLTTSSKEQRLAGDESRSPSKSNSYEQISGYETIQECDLHVPTLKT